MISVGNFEMQPLATALDIARLALAPMISTAAERAVKLLQRNLTGLTEGLGARPALAESALSEYGIAIQAIAVEARLLAQPVSFELVSTTQAEGIEDRMTMAPLAARRLEEMVGLGARVASIELMLAAQACDLRGATARGRHGPPARQRSALRPVPRRGRVAPGPRAARRGDPLGEDLRLTMAGFDVHQHLWPRAFSEALAAAHRASLPRRRRPARVRGRIDRRPPRSRARDPDRPARPPRDRHGRRLAAAVARARGARPVRARAPRSDLGGRDPRARGRGPRPDRSARSRPAATGLRGGLDRRRPAGSTWTTSRRRSTRCADTGSSSSTRSPASPPAAAPAWWPAVVDYTSQMQRAYFAWLAGAQERWPDVTVVFAILAGGAPIQLERLVVARRRRPLVAPPERLLRHRVVRPARARAVHRDLRRRAARLRHATPPSSTRRRRFAPSMRSVSPSPASSVRTT